MTLAATSAASPTAIPTQVVIPLSKAAVWLITATFLALAVYYFVGIDQGATSVFGSNTVIHEFVHDARHFSASPVTEPISVTEPMNIAGKLILRGLLVGAIAGLLAFVFARIFAEPVISRAIDYESARDEAQHTLDKAAGLTVYEHGHDIFSRTIQANLGIGVGMIAFGAAVGTLFAVVYTVCLGRVGMLRPRTLAVLVAGGGFLALYLVPFLAYPANPPAIGHEDTIKERSGLYLLMVAAAIVFLVLAVLLGKRLAVRFGNWNATLIAAAAYVVLIGAVMALLPSFGMLAINVQNYGAQATETPLPLLDAKGAIVFPGFPADDLFQFRLYSVGAQLVLWAAIGLLFAPLARRVLEPTARPRQASGDRETAAV